MNPFRRVQGPLLPLDRADVDTDQIIPKQFLKRVDRTGYGEVLFHDWRRRPDGSPDPGFVLNDPRYAGTPILVTGPNFGCGSSREHAAWAIADAGFRALIAPSFADIFRSNCFANGILPVEIKGSEIRALLNAALEEPGIEGVVDLEGCFVEAPGGRRIPFSIDPFSRECLLAGHDEIEATLQLERAICAWEERSGRG